MDIQLQCSSKSQERVNIWTFEVLIGRKRGGSRWPSSPTLLPRLRLPGKPGDATVTHADTFFDQFPGLSSGSRCVLSWPLIVTAVLAGTAAFLVCRSKFHLNLIIKYVFALWQSNGSLHAEKGSGGGDLPREGGGESDDNQGGEKNLQLQRNTLRSTSPRQPKVQEARTYHLLVRHSQLQTRNEKESSAPCAFP